MTVKMNDLSAATRDALAAEFAAKSAAYAAPYQTIADQAARQAEVAQAAAKDAREARGGLWKVFRQALSAAQAAGHTPSTMGVGLEIACSEKGVPKGSSSSYVVTLRNLLADVQEGKIALKDAEALSIADARKRYRQLTPMQSAMNALYNAVEGWTVEEIMELVEVASGKGDEDIALEIISIGQRHAEERAKAEENAAPVEEKQAA